MARNACSVPCSIFGCRALPVRSFLRCRTHIYRKKHSVRELRILLIYSRCGKEFISGRGYYNPAL